VIISDRLWKQRFDGDPAIIGRRVMVDGEPAEVIGVMPPRFNFPEGCDIWSPFWFDPKRPPSRNARFATVIGRLKPGKTLEDAQAESGVIAARLARDYKEDRDYGVRAYTLTRGMLDEGTGPMLSMWQVSAFIVLLIACANIANLLLARAGERRRETAVRLAIGASRVDVMRELLTESVLLALVSVPGAIGFAWLSLYAIRISMPANILRFVPGFESLGPDFRLVSFTIGLALLTAVIFGLLPALQAGRGSVSETLKEGGRTATGRQLLRRGLVIGEIAIALPLLVTAGLGALGTRQFLSGPQGYDPDGLLTMKLVLPDRAYPDPASQRLFIDKAIAAVEPIAGVSRVSVVNNPPASGGAASRRVDIDGHPAPDPNHLPIVDMRAATPGYLSTMRIPLVSGRDFTTADREDSTPVAIVSESMARKFWPNEDPIGRRFKTPADGKGWITVVGICGDIIHDWFNRHDVPTIYRPYRQQTTNYFGVMIRTAGDPSSLAAPVRRALLGVDPTQPVFDVMTMKRALHERTIGLQYLVAIMTVFGGIALLLASVGLYALISYLVVQRRHEIGVRIALGASRTQVVRLTIGQAFRLAVTGSAIGLLLSIALARVIQAGLIGVGHSDPRVFAGFAGVLIGTALLAGYVPARRAAAIDPMVALRTE
jgi:putative ABC transport system permease protein